MKDYYDMQVGYASQYNTTTHVNMYTDTARLWVPVPWYSEEYQDVIKTDSMNLYGNAMTGGFYTQHTTGQKQYEFTDHLGDVLATVSDKRSGNTFTALPGTTLTAGSPALLDTWKPVVVSAYDYYPFGQYMPGRYFVDTGSHCYTATISELVPQVYYTWQPWVLIESAGITGIGGVKWTDGGTPVSGTLQTGRKSDGIRYNITGVPIDVPTQLFLRTGTIKGTFTASITEDSSSKVIGSVQLSDKQGADFIYPIPFISTTGRIRVTITSTITGAALLQFIGQQVPHDTMIPQNVVTTVCNNDWYRYGFNGQMKVNEWAGVGDHTTALYWEYDTRICNRINKDEWNDNVSVSSYSVFDRNPILKSDHLGNTPNRYDVNGQTGEVKKIDDEGGDKTDYVHLHYDVPIHLPETTAVLLPAIIPGFTGLPEGDYQLPVQKVWDRQGAGFGNNSRTPGLLHMGSPWTGRAELVDDPFTSIGPGLIYGLGKRVIISASEKMLGSPQVTGTFGHAFFSKMIGFKYALNPNVDRVTFDLGYKKLWGVAILDGGRDLT